MNNADFHALTAAIFTAPTFKPTAAAQTLAAKVDRLGALFAAIAALERESSALRADLEATGLTDIDGNMYRAHFAQAKGATRTDWQAVAVKFNPSRQLIAAHTSTGKESTRMTIKAHPTH